MCKPWKISGAPEDYQLKPSELRLVQPDEGRPPKRHKASRQKWCRGKEGVEHILAWMPYAEVKGAPRYPSQADERFLICLVCGKELMHRSGC
jgi:hypothetical protein